MPSVPPAADIPQPPTPYYTDESVTQDSEGVGTGAGEGATGQDTGTAWVTRSEDCPEAPAQAHPLGPDGFTPLATVAAYRAAFYRVLERCEELKTLVGEHQWNALEMARKADSAERRAEEAEYHVEQLRDARDSAERRNERACEVLDGWEHDGPKGYEFHLLILRVREALDGAIRACRRCGCGVDGDEQCPCGCDEPVECAHEWLDRPESDTRECLICGTEAAG